MTTNPPVASAGEENCPLICKVTCDKNDNKETLGFRRDGTKKSAFLLDCVDAAVSSFDAPAHCCIESMDGDVFALGGFQLVSNARTVEIYTLVLQEEQEAYLTTCRGIPAKEIGEDFYKIVCAVPGGPKPVRKLHLKLLSIKPDNSETARIVSMNLTARLRDAIASPGVAVEAFQQQTTPSSAPSSSSSASAAAAPLLSVNSPSRASSGLSQDDVGAAMAGVSFMMRSAEERIAESIQQSNQTLHQAMVLQLSQLQQQVHQLTLLQLQQHTVLEQQSRLLQSQANKLEQQTLILANMQEQLELKGVLLQYVERFVAYLDRPTILENGTEAPSTHHHHSKKKAATAHDKDSDAIDAKLPSTPTSVHASTGPMATSQSRGLDMEHPSESTLESKEFSEGVATLTAAAGGAGEVTQVNNGEPETRQHLQDDTEGNKIPEAQGSKLLEAEGNKVSEAEGNKIQEADGNKIPKTEADGNKIPEEEGSKIPEGSVDPTISPTIGSEPRAE